MNEILSALEESIPSEKNTDFRVQQLTESSTWFAGRDSLGRAVFVIREIADPARALNAGGLAIEIGLSLRADVSGQEETLSRCVLLTLTKSERALEPYFAQICLVLARELAALNSQDEVLRNLDVVIRLFRFKEVSRESIKGFWGELKVVATHPRPSEFLSAWQADGFSRIDFHVERVGLEVKTAEGGVRKHMFSARQVANGDTLVASLLIEETAAGETISELSEFVAKCVDRAALFKLGLRTAPFLTSSLSRTLRFRLLEGDLAPRLYRAGDLPRPVIKREDEDCIENVSFGLHIANSLPFVPLLGEGDVMAPDAIKLFV